MKNSTKILLLVLFVIVFAIGLIFWADNSPIGGDGQSSPPPDLKKIQLAFSFAFALSRNDPEAYEMSDPNLKPRLDEWMNSHKSQKCVGEIISSFIRAGTNVGDKITFSCSTKTSYLSFEVDDIVIKDLKVIDWGEVRETDG